MLHKGYPRSLAKRFGVELREKLGTEAPEVLHMWVEPNANVPGATLKAHLSKGGVERIDKVAVGSGGHKYNWEDAYQRLLAACLDAWGPADSTERDGP